MDYIICIPSYKREYLCETNTLAMLKTNEIDKNKIFIFVASSDEYDLYYNFINKDLYNQLIVGVLGLKEQKTFIENYYEEGKQILYLDDDIKEIDLDSFNSLDDLIQTGFRECKNKGSFIWSIYPVYNPFFRKTKEHLSTSLKLCIGAFCGIINRPNNENIKLEFCGDREDVERTIKYFINDGIVLRFNKVGYKTKFFNTGGLGTLKQRYDTITQEVMLLNEKYGEYGKVRQKKDYLDFQLKPIKTKKVFE